MTQMRSRQAGRRLLLVFFWRVASHGNLNLPKTKLRNKCREGLRRAEL